MALNQGQGNQLPHLSLPLIVRERARLGRGGKPSALEDYNKTHREEHSANLKVAAETAIESWSNRLQQRAAEQLPVIPSNIPLFVRVDPDSDIEFLRHFFKLEIVSEQDDGYIIVASEEVDMATFLGTVERFSNNIRGATTTAKIFEVIGPDNQQLRLERILSGNLLSRWGDIDNAETITVDIGIECLGSVYIKTPPEQKEDEPDIRFAAKLEAWRAEVHAVQGVWDDLMSERENQIITFVNGHGGQILDILHDDHLGAAYLPDSFTVRISISGLGLRDLVFNYPYLFEVREPDELEGIATDIDTQNDVQHELEFESPDANAPAVCIIDSGIQEQHPLLSNAIDSPSSMCFIPGLQPTDVADYVLSGGHGTRVAGAVIFPRDIPTIGSYKMPCWIQNARVLDANNLLPTSLYPPLYLRAITEKFAGELGTKLFNHSIAASNPCRLQSMSAWAAAIDMLSWQYDVLFFQSAGNLISLGGIDEPSPYSTSGLGIWGSIKPEVVEYGGGMVSDNAATPTLTTPSEVCTELLRSTMHGGPLFAKDTIGTSFSAPKVSAIAVAIQHILPNEPALLYRSLIVNSARWPIWASNSPNKLSALRKIGYGIPDLDRATSNTPYRVTLITHGENRLKAKEAQIYQIPVPAELRAPGSDYQIRIDVTLSYVARPRRTRRNVRQYLSTWADWRSSKIGETLDSFKNRALWSGNPKMAEREDVIPWEIRERDDLGNIEGVKRNTGTVQKDWVVLNSHQLPQDFCIAVVGHAGWDLDPDAYAKYALSITFEAIDQDVEIYQRIQTSVNSIQISSIEAQVLI